MVANKCEICKEELGLGFMDKISGTVVKIKKGENNKSVYVCSACQKEHGDNLKGKLEE